MDPSEQVYAQVPYSSGWLERSPKRRYEAWQPGCLVITLQTMANTHDPAYKQLFSHPEMVSDLLRGYIHGDWVKQIDFSTLERLPDSFVTDDLRGRYTP